jgi:hypothetical protein
MSRSIWHFFAWILLAAGLWMSADRARAQEPPKPSPEHELFKSDVGTWDASLTVWPTPDAQPMTMKGSETNELLGDGMWLIGHFESNFGGMPFKGLGTMGYAPVEKKYVGSWVDGMGPYMTTMKGDYDPATKTLTMMAETRDAATGKPVTQKHITHFVDKNTKTFEIQQQGDDGKFWKMLEIQYKRAAE